jgi:hypothetical protein
MSSYIEAKANYVSSPLMVGESSSRSQQGVVTATAVPVVAPASVVAYTAYVIPEEPRKRAYCGGACCAFCCIIFLILLFLVPRPPRAYLSASTVTCCSSLSVVQQIEVYNGNFYSLHLSNLDGTITTGFLVNGQTLVGSAQFVDDSGQPDDSVVIARASTQTIQVLYTFNSSLAVVAAADAAYYCVHGGAEFITQGKLDMKTWSANFHDVSYGTFVAIVVNSAYYKCICRTVECQLRLLVLTSFAFGMLPAEL